MDTSQPWHTKSCSKTRHITSSIVSRQGMPVVESNPSTDTVVRDNPYSCFRSPTWGLSCATVNAGPRTLLSMLYTWQLYLFEPLRAHVGSVDFLVVSLIFLSLQSFLPPSAGFPKLHLMFVSESLHEFLSVAGWILSDDRYAHMLFCVAWVFTGLVHVVTATVSSYMHLHCCF